MNELGGLRPHGALGARQRDPLVMALDLNFAYGILGPGGDLRSAGRRRGQLRVWVEDRVQRLGRSRATGSRHAFVLPRRKDAIY